MCSKQCPRGIHAAPWAKRCRIALIRKVLFGPISRACHQTATAAARAKYRHQCRRFEVPKSPGAKSVRNLKSNSRRLWHVRFECERDTVDAVAQPGRRRAVFEAMTEVAATAGAMHLRARHQEHIVR